MKPGNVNGVKVRFLTCYIGFKLVLLRANVYSIGYIYEVTILFISLIVKNIIFRQNFSTHAERMAEMGCLIHYICRRLCFEEFLPKPTF